MRIFVITVILLCVGNTVLAQRYYPGKIEFTDGTTKTGFIKPPTDPAEKKIEYKQNEKGDVTIFQNHQIKLIEIVGEDSETYEYIHSETIRTKKNGQLAKANAQWLTVLVKGHATLYGLGHAMRVRKNGELVVSASGPVASINFYVKREGEEYPTLVGVYMQGSALENKFLREHAGAYFNDCPEIIKRIEAKAFKVFDISILVTEYNKWQKKDCISGLD